MMRNCSCGPRQYTVVGQHSLKTGTVLGTGKDRPRGCRVVKRKFSGSSEPVVDDQIPNVVRCCDGQGEIMKRAHHTVL